MMTSKFHGWSIGAMFLSLCLSPVVAVNAAPIAASPAAASTDLSQPLTLDRAIRIGLQNQDNIAIAASQVVASQAQVVQSRANYYPTVGPSYTYSSQLTTQTINGHSITGTATQSITQISADQLLFDMGKREENAAQSRAQARAAQYNLNDVRQSVVLNIAVDYYELLRRKELVRVADSSKQRAQETLDATKAFAAAGTGAKKDILQAQADYENDNVLLIQAQNNVQVAESNLKNAMGLVSTQPIVTPAQPPAAPPAAPDTRTMADYLAEAEQNRQDLKRAGQQIEANRHTVRVATIQSGLQIQSTLSEGYRVSPDAGENRGFGVGVTYPLFDGGAARAQVRAAKATLKQAQLQQDLNSQAVQLDVQQFYLTREQARASTQATQAALLAAQENYNAAQDARKQGAGTILDVITAQNELVTAETNRVQAIYDYYTADANLNRAIGANDPARPGTTKPGKI